MMASMETYLRQGQRQLRRWALEPRVQQLGRVLAYGGSGFLLSAASLNRFAQPLAMGLICAFSGWQAAVISLGAVLGYGVFWGPAGYQGMFWAILGLALAWIMGRNREEGEQPLLIPAMAALLTAVSGLSFQIFFRDDTPLGIYLLRIGLSAGAALLFSQARRRQDAMVEWAVGGIGVLALAQVAPVQWLGLGYVAAGMMASSRAFPAAVLAGLGLDLAQVTRVPMTAVLCIAYFLRMLPVPGKWLRYSAPALGCLMTMALCGIWEVAPVPGLVLGGFLGTLLPPRPEAAHRRGETGILQVRLELSAGVLAQTQQLLLETALAPIDERALIHKARERACSGCSARSSCTQQEFLTAELLHHPLEFQCRKTGRILGELRRAKEQLRLLQADRQRQEEYRWAVIQQYQFLSEYLRCLSDQLPQRGDRIRAYYRIELSARSKGKERANGDRCLAFSGAGCRYYVLLCDGMGTGLGAAQEGQSTGKLLRQMLSAGYPADHALRTINSILALRGQAGAVTVDLAEIRLDTGRIALYKWGAAPSWVLRRKGTEKIGTATPPPGISVRESRESVVRLSLRRGEALILLSDGIDGEGVLRRAEFAPEATPGEIAEWLLEEGCARAEDDATAVALRLRPLRLSQ